MREEAVLEKSIFLKLYDLIKRDYPQFSSLWLKSREEFGPRWEKEISTNIARVFGETRSQRWDEAVEGYAEFCIDALRAQVYFEKTGTYEQKDYSAVLRDCYHSADYMNRRYLPGQYLSHYIWPHHQKMLRHFVDKLLPQVVKDVKLFYEVGVGCGMYSQKTLENLPGSHGAGFDISDFALNFTLKTTELHGFAGRYKIFNQNVIDTPTTELADMVISQEVLEHLDDPESFIRALHRMTRPGGWGYITAAINAAHTDHIYHYHTPKEVQDQLEKSGWRVADAQIESNYPEKPEHLRPTIAGYLVRKN